MQTKACLDRIEALKQAYALKPHPEGGWFSEVYTAPFERDGRPLAGSIHFLLDGGELSHFHEIDCDEIWYHHEGCGLKLTILCRGEMREILLGRDVAGGQRAMAVVPAGAVFAAENLDAQSYAFLSCATTPAFRYDGFRLIGQRELAARFPRFFGQIGYLAAGVDEP